MLLWVSTSSHLPVTGEAISDQKKDSKSRAPLFKKSPRNKTSAKNLVNAKKLVQEILYYKEQAWVYIHSNKSK